MPTPAYAGIGSRETPREILGLMTSIAHHRSPNWILHSGGARGADTAFALGASRKVIFRPEDTSPDHWSYILASRHHPNWRACSPYARLLHARNSLILLGSIYIGPVPWNPLPNLSYYPLAVTDIICWTPNAQPVGGTGQALRIALTFQIPIYNLANPSVRSSFITELTPD